MPVFLQENTHLRCRTYPHQRHVLFNAHRSNTRLSAAAPHTLEVAVPLGEPVHAVVALAHRAHETAQSVGLVLAGVAAVLVNVADGDLGRGVVGGLDDAVRRGALAGDVTFRRDRLSALAGHAIADVSSVTGRGYMGLSVSRGSRNLQFEMCAELPRTRAECLAYRNPPSRDLAQLRLAHFTRTTSCTSNTNARYANKSPKLKTTICNDQSGHSRKQATKKPSNATPLPAMTTGAWLEVVACWPPPCTKLFELDELEDESEDEPESPEFELDESPDDPLFEESEDPPCPEMASLPPPEIPGTVSGVADADLDAVEVLFVPLAEADFEALWSLSLSSPVAKKLASSVIVVCLVAKVLVEVVRRIITLNVDVADHGIVVSIGHVLTVPVDLSTSPRQLNTGRRLREMVLLGRLVVGLIAVDSPELLVIDIPRNIIRLPVNRVAVLVSSTHGGRPTKILTVRNSLEVVVALSMVHVYTHKLEINLVLDITHKDEGCDNTRSSASPHSRADLSIPDVFRAHDQRVLLEYLGSHPPRQYAPTPHWPYCEQQGADSGQGLFSSQVVAADAEMAKVAASAAYVLKDLMALTVLHKGQEWTRRVRWYDLVWPRRPRKRNDRIE
ncbi:hypothetical protein KC341_g103 [Hortaea werneckii]|nr:hypothetical protein KC341_g103 [Hortaea werneckii]